MWYYHPYKVVLKTILLRGGINMPKFFWKAKDPISSYTHFLGAVFAVIGTILLIVKTAMNPESNIWHVLSVVIFAISLIALYSASSIYHFVNFSDAANFRLRKLDHSMIFVLIAGTYTPLIYNLFRQPMATYFTIVMWVIAFIGILLKVFFFRAPRWLSTILYIAMGWAIVVDLPAVAALGPVGIALLVAGGIAYTAGGVIYIIKKPNFSKNFGFHEFFHIFVLLGSLCHFFCVYYFVA